VTCAVHGHLYDASRGSETSTVGVGARHDTGEDGSIAATAVRDCGPSQVTRVSLHAR